ncbi:ribbon-helix-helix domain-containing protein [Komagataeibacter sp. FNDCF1]|uniref:ribbon-helix-helix domain-containing protein n=1 Tax=Komagataeibacter sp. FNDCF1 TaxID=2878681 RepID=UPI001E55C902|nr:ribbon-helix-helix domain-containing protein [Komagataeibacter sp. FNDCF1]MCE2565591.1 ribbon-helix-helix domain-containing protein [Komagataeibacter sp. FNDCF1]
MSGSAPLPLPTQRGARLLHKRSLNLSGHRTSVALEPEFWHALRLIAHGRGLTLAGLVGQVDGQRPPDRPLASALRVEALREWMPALPEMPDTDREDRLG